MNGETRREEILHRLQSSNKVLSGSALAKEFGVSRQVIVTDIALLRAQGIQIIPTHWGYVLRDGEHMHTRIYKVKHTEEQAREEMEIFVDQGAFLQDVFIHHKVYGTIRGELNIRSRRDITNYLNQLEAGSSRLLSRSTSGYHYHTVSAASEEVLDDIEKELRKHGFLAEVRRSEEDQ